MVSTIHLARGTQKGRLAATRDVTVDQILFGGY